MAVPANTLTTLNVVGNREDLSNEAHRISPEATPFTSNIGTAKASATYTEWQLESLEDINPDNSQLDGDDSTATAPNLRDRVGNRVQTFKKVGSVAGIQRAVSTAATVDDLDREKMLKIKAMKRDIEFAALRNSGSNEQTGATTRKMAGAQAWMETNVSFGTGGAAGGFASGNVTAYTPGTARAFTEDLVRDVMLQRFNTTGEQGTNLQMYLSGKHKEEFGSFAGLSETRDTVSGNKGKRVVYGAADVYVSNFGTITAIAHAYGIADAALIIDPSYWKMATVRKVFSEELANTGDNSKFQIITDTTVKACNEKSSALIAALL